MKKHLAGEGEEPRCSTATIPRSTAWETPTPSPCRPARRTSLVPTIGGGSEGPTQIPASTSHTAGSQSFTSTHLFKNQVQNPLPNGSRSTGINRAWDCYPAGRKGPQGLGGGASGRWGVRARKRGAPVLLCPNPLSCTQPTSKLKRHE